MTSPNTSTDDVIEHIEDMLRQDFAPEQVRFAIQRFNKHVELWIYVRDTESEKRIRTRCGELSESEQLEKRVPEIWLIINVRSGPWPGEDPEEELRVQEELARRREDFKRRHNISFGKKAA